MSSRASRGAIATRSGVIVHPQLVRPEAVPSELVALVGVAMLAGVYWIVRSGGYWADTDSSFMANAIRSVAGDGALVPAVPEVYANGYGYQVVSAVIVAFAGIDVAALQQYVYPLLTGFVVLAAWALYRELIGSSSATFATLLLLLVPGHLFTVLRGSHEPLDRVFAFATIWLLVRGMRLRREGLASAVHVGLALAMTYALIATNNLFGISFVGALGTALAMAWLLQRGPSSVRSLAREAVIQLRWITVAGALMVGIFIFFVYPPAEHSLRQLLTVPSGIATAVLTDAPDTSPYPGVLAAWVRPEVYFLLSLGEYVLIAGSALTWLWQGWRWLRGAKPQSFGVWLLWLLFAAFGLQLVLAIVSDRTGALANNLQYRSFTVFAGLAVATLAQGLVQLGAPRWPKHLVRVGLTLFAAAALLKATNEPIVSNQWTFYTPMELAGTAWADEFQRSTLTWVGPDQRLAAAHSLAIGEPTRFNRWAYADPAPPIRAYLVSDVVRVHSARLGVPVPAVGLHNLVYDSGTVQLYRARALAPFQR